MKKKEETVKPDETGYWWAEQENGKVRCFEVMKTGDKKKPKIRVFHGSWWTVEHIEKSFKITRWLGQAFPPEGGE